MTYSLSYVPEVEMDVIAGYLWYEEKSKGLGEDFLRLFYASSREIPRQPYLYHVVYNDFRRKLLRRFPYAAYYRIENDLVIVYGLFHCARKPHVIKSSLDSRET